MRTLPASTPRPLFDHYPGSSTSPATSSPSDASPLTPPPMRQPALPCTTLSYEGVRYSVPIRNRTVSLRSPPATSPPMLPIGKPSPPQPLVRSRRTVLPAGLGLVDLDKLAAAPSPRADASREERAHRRRAVHFHSHAHFSEALRLNLARPDGTRIPPDRLHACEWHAPRQDEDENENEFSWEAEDPGLSPPSDTTSHEYMQDLAAEFPQPPKSTPEFPLSLASGFALEGPPRMPLPPTPPFVDSPHIFASVTYSDANRLTVIDPDTSMAQLEMSMAKLEVYNPSAQSGCFFDDDDDESELDLQDSEVEEQPPPQAYTSTLSDNDAENVVLEEQLDEAAQRRSYCITPDTFARVGFTAHPSSSSVATQSTAAEDSAEGKPPVDLLPHFDFETMRQTYHQPDQGQRRRSSSLADMRRKLHVHWEDEPDVPSRPSDSSASSYSRPTTADSDAPRTETEPATHSRESSTSSGEYRSRGTQAGDGRVRARPDSPLRKAKSVPFIRRSIRREEPPPVPVPPPHPPAPAPASALQHTQHRHRPHAPPLPTSLSLAGAQCNAPSPPQRQSKTLVRAHSHSHVRGESQAGSPPRTPPNGDAGMQSFMHITPEQPPSRMSRLWNRARAGISMGGGGAGGRAEGGPLKSQRSMRWLRGSVSQSRSEK
ncbi:hypothetical protein IEO21_01417 [Rhodonia placenta]|uniref:Uncharacterized protein n=1 Tax=Rhodonia placenta TaxID=104341 RepID=A0A8H7P9M1_9APHY|nr:hypothetical protein IEO21_01417 [Postia placenta]